MKIVIWNGPSDVGGFGIPSGWRKNLGLEGKPRYEIERIRSLRTDPVLIELVEKSIAINARMTRGSRSLYGLAIVDIPDEATDWAMDDRDGVEWVMFVLDGKIHCLGGDGVPWKYYFRKETCDANSDQ